MNLTKSRALSVFAALSVSADMATVRLTEPRWFDTALVRAEGVRRSLKSWRRGRRCKSQTNRIRIWEREGKDFERYGAEDAEMQNEFRIEWRAKGRKETAEEQEEDSLAAMACNSFPLPLDRRRRCRLHSPQDRKFWIRIVSSVAARTHSNSQLDQERRRDVHSVHPRRHPGRPHRSPKQKRQQLLESTIEIVCLAGSTRASRPFPASASASEAYTASVSPRIRPHRVPIRQHNQKKENRRKPQATERTHHRAARLTPPSPSSIRIEKPMKKNASHLTGIPSATSYASEVGVMEVVALPAWLEEGHCCGEGSARCDAFARGECGAEVERTDHRKCIAMNRNGQGEKTKRSTFRMRSRRPDTTTLHTLPPFKASATRSAQRAD
ncbi:hypothetical protein B0H13DRAFT_1901064 [Mycena leptocephala]|nr:hypothetical protein B0H13DRAFT_1901064 [Mycena leptocephala]